MKNYQSFSSEETRKFGESLAKKILTPLSSRLSPRALTLALQGDLGAGKTTFTQGFFKGLGIRRRAVSPTFVIMRHYKIPGRRSDKRPAVAKAMAGKHVTNNTDFTDIYHFDAYRLKKVEDLAVLEFDRILSDPRNIILIEWPERIKEVLPKNAIWLRFQHSRKENERKIIIKE
jgi:tRNA threonylcarbamoyladenosine biosynthesis protein TsaE